MSRRLRDDNADAPLFTDDDDEIKPDQVRPDCWNVLVVDDDIDVIGVTRLVFGSFTYENRPIRILPATSAQQAKTILAEEPNIAAAYIDVVMESDYAGLDLVRYIRKDLGNHDIQLILRTGQPGFAPEMKVILDYGINDYRIKTELENIKLITTLVTALRNFENIQRAKASARRQVMAESVSEAKSLFFAQMSHDFRTPLNSVMGFCELLLASPLEYQQKEHVQLIHQSGQYLLHLVNEILDFSKGEAGQMRLDEADFAPAKLIRDIFKQLHPQVHPGVSFRLHMADDMPVMARGDAFRIRQVLHNLLSNALKFTQQGSVELAAVVAESGPDGWMLQIEIRDTGIGIAPENLSRLFSAYQQADQMVGREFGGTGLGLLICKQLVALMGGDIKVVSTLGQGTRFTVTLKLSAPNLAGARKITETTVVKLHKGQRPFNGENILIVDDDPSNRLLVARILQSAGLNVVEAASGADAIAAAAASAFDLILTDCGLPDMDGFELSQRLRSMPMHANTPIVALSGSDPGEVKERITSSGMNEFVQKPVRVPAINSVLERWLPGQDAPDTK